MVAEEIVELLLRHAFVSADGRVRIDSDGTSNEHRDLELGEHSEAPVDPSRPLKRKLVEGPPEKEPRLVRGDPPSFRKASDSAADPSEDEPGDPGRFAVSDPGHT